MNALSLAQLAVHHAVVRPSQRARIKQAQVAAILFKARLLADGGADLKAALDDAPPGNFELRVFEINSGPTTLAAEFRTALANILPSHTVVYESLVPSMLTEDGSIFTLEDLEKALAARLHTFAQELSNTPDDPSDESARAEAVTLAYNNFLNSPFAQDFKLPEPGTIDLVLVPDLGFAAAENLKSIFGIFGVVQNLLNPETGRVFVFPPLPLDSGGNKEQAEALTAMFSDGRSVPDYYVSALNRNFRVSPNSSGLAVFDEEENVETIAEGHVAATFNQQTGFLHLNYLNVQANVLEASDGKTVTLRDTSSFEPFEVKVFVPPLSAIPMLLNAFNESASFKLRGHHYYDPLGKIKRSLIRFQPTPTITTLPMFDTALVAVQEYQFAPTPVLNVLLPSEAAAIAAELEAQNAQANLPKTVASETEAAVTSDTGDSDGDEEE